MCGIIGFFLKNEKYSSEKFAHILKSMTDPIYHRGPDGEGSWIDEEAGIALGHRRLSILDLSPEGHQPMLTASGRFCIIYNGEIYNFTDIRRELEELGCKFRGHSDTEILLAAIEQWGVVNAVKKATGMFAATVFDRREKKIYLFRDRMGEKPLYYGWMGDTFLFGSELKSLRKHPAFRGDIDRDALALYLRYSYIPAPYSIYKGIFKLPPGTIGTLDLMNPAKEINLIEYWSVNDAVVKGMDDPFTGADEEAVEELDRLIRNSVRRQMRADVPLGAFLSGGVDSSVVVALMQQQSKQAVKTFTIGFNEAGYNEAEHAMAVARHLQTDHTELYVTPNEALAVIPHLPQMYDEPFADASQIPTFLVSQLARQKVTVSLSGDGGDELFGGYSRYFEAMRAWGKIEVIPRPVRTMIASSMKSIPPHLWDHTGVFLPGQGRRPGDKIHRIADVLSLKNGQELYQRLISQWNPYELIISGSEVPTWPFSSPQIANYTEWMMYKDSVNYLPDDILVKVDRAGMAASLESRVPMLDHQIVEFSWRLPLSMKIRDGKGKWLLRQVLYKYVPPSLIDRPKMGFGVPIDHWLRGPLKDWAESLLSQDLLEQQGFFQAEPIRKKWNEHLSGRRNWQYALWPILMFQSWLESNGNKGIDVAVPELSIY
ncbi:asparagine synthase (glutamine-hydrolyzing) [Paenibacillus sp. OV219]|uniref:asparagine synthase (glutamine-hydrolyzing) n=1 Tax=Paenibacillus sp. OV219 TaxID=1884377 RepID=UPI0008C84985|nr:asparagine synthase (glutamine-hydrolyzing) [Paenibacillus sp. OV219]SEO64306.1 asparagine synthase (glutamine-hydrolysing) [Paenibacillus sp. OV219]